jgi:hypothetical protein
MTEETQGRSTLAVLLAVAGGLVTAAGSVAPWLRFQTEREVAEVVLPEVETVEGLALAPALLPLGLAAAIAGLSLLVLRGRAQQAAAVLVLVAGVGAGVLIVAGLAGAEAGGEIASGAVLAVLGALLLVAAGTLGMRPARPARLPARYDLDDDDTDDEWRLASGDEDTP